VFLVLLVAKLQQASGAPDPTLAPLSWTLAFVPLHIAHLALVLPVALWLTGRATAPRSSEELHRCHRDERALFLSDGGDDGDGGDDDETAGDDSSRHAAGGQEGTIAYSVVADLGPGVGGASWSPHRPPLDGGTLDIRSPASTKGPPSRPHSQTRRARTASIPRK
jgi:hypothetical protein